MTHLGQGAVAWSAPARRVVERQQEAARTRTTASLPLATSRTTAGHQLINNERLQPECNRNNAASAGWRRTATRNNGIGPILLLTILIGCR